MATNTRYCQIECQNCNIKSISAERSQLNVDRTIPHSIRPRHSCRTRMYKGMDFLPLDPLKSSAVKCAALAVSLAPLSLGRLHRDFAVAQLHGRRGRLCAQSQLQTEDGFPQGKRAGPQQQLALKQGSAGASSTQHSGLRGLLARTSSCGFDELCAQVPLFPDSEIPQASGPKSPQLRIPDFLRILSNATLA